MRWISNLFKKNLTTQIQQKISELIRPPIGESYTDQNSVNKYRSWIYICSNYNATNIASAELELYSNITPKVSKYKSISNKKYKEVKSLGMQINENTKEITNHPIIDLLNKPNDEDTLYSLLYKIQLFLELTGDCYLLVEKDTRGIPSAIYVLYSQYINIQTDAMNNVIKYNYGVMRGDKWQYSYSPDEIIHIKNFNPASLHYGISPLEAVARSNSLIEAQTTYEQALNKNMGVVSGILTYNNKENIRSQDRDLIEATWQKKFSGSSRAGKIIVTSKDVSYQNLGVFPRDMAWMEGRIYSRQEIMCAYGINEAMLLTENVNRSNMETSNINYYKNTLNPRLKLISQTLTQQLINKNGIDGRGLFIRIYKEAPRDEDLLISKLKLLVDSKALTVNELRDEFDFDTIEGADNFIEISKPAEVKNEV